MRIAYCFFFLLGGGGGDFHQCYGQTFIFVFMTVSRILHLNVMEYHACLQFFYY